MQQQQDWHFRIKGELIYGTGFLHLHEENFVNMIVIHDYFEKNMPMILTRLAIDNNLFDYIINNADYCTIILNTTKFTKAVSGEINSAEVEHIKGEYSVFISSDINYHKELDYAEALQTDHLVQDKWRETYIGLVPKACLDANKAVANENIFQTMTQDLVLSYLLPNCHPLIEPFDHNEMVDQLILPPLDTLSSIIEYLNDMKVFYDTEYTLYFDEPNVTYLISRSGRGVKMKGEKHNTVQLNMRGINDQNSLTLGMADDNQNDMFSADISVFDSVYNIDHTTNKVFDSIDSIINPSIDTSALANESFKTLKQQLQNTMKQYVDNIIQKSLAAGNIGEKLASSIPKMNFAIGKIQKAAANLQTTIKNNIADFMNQIPTLPEMPTLPSPGSGGFIGGDGEEGEEGQPKLYGLTAMEKSIKMSLMNSQFAMAEVSQGEQAQVKSHFSEQMESTANQYYNQDYLDNLVSAVTYINLPDVSKATTGLVDKIQSSVSDIVSKMQTEVTSRMGHFQNFVGELGSMNSQLGEWKSILEGWQAEIDAAKAAAEEGGGDSGSSSGDDGESGSGSTNPSVPDYDFNALIASIGSQMGGLTLIKGTADKYGGIAESTESEGRQEQNTLSDSVGGLTDLIGGFVGVDKSDIKSMFIKDTPTRIFGSSDLGIEQILLSGGTGSGCFGGQGTKSLANIDLSNIGNLISGTLDFSDLANLKQNLSNFNLREIGSLGLGHIAFNLGLGKIPGVGDIIGTKIFKVKNDNPNKLKNIKSEIENSKNELCFNKFGLDPSVFTPNKRYVISNYSGHDNKDGVFILREKVEIYTREDDTCLCNTQLYFNKILEEEASTSTSKARDISKPNSNSDSQDLVG